jgi:hypothetical protein
MEITTGSRQAARHAHTQPVFRLQRGAVGAHVLDAAFGIFGHAERRGQIGRSVEAGRGNGHRQARQAAFLQRVAADHHLLAGRLRHHDGWNRLGYRLRPGLADLVDRQTQAGGVDLRRGGKPADQHRDVISPAVAVDHVGEQERAALIFVQAALELPARERVQLRILVDRSVDADQQSLGFQPGDMFLQVARRTAGCCRLRKILRR